jgi:hypothetical protein
MMEVAWAARYQEAKLSVNSLIGLWAIDEAAQYKHRSSAREDDSPGDCLKSTFHYKDGFVYDFVSTKILASNASCRPLHDLCMSTELVRVGQILLELKRVRAIP